MKYVLVFFIGTTLYLLIQNRFDDRYEHGYANGMKNALRTNPPSEELEMTCAGLWVGQQNKKYWERTSARQY